MHNYAKVTAHFSDAIQLIYFEAKCKPNQAGVEFILAIDETNAKFNLNVIHNLVDEINALFNLEPPINK